MITNCTDDKTGRPDVVIFLFSSWFPFCSIVELIVIICRSSLRVCFSCGPRVSQHEHYPRFWIRLYCDPTNVLLCHGVEVKPEVPWGIAKGGCENHRFGRWVWCSELMGGMMRRGMEVGVVPCLRLHLKRGNIRLVRLHIGCFGKQWDTF